MALSNVRVVIVEDQPTIRKDMLTLMEKQRGFVVVGTCGSVQEAVAIISATEPDLLLLDISLDDGTAFDILQQVPNSFKTIFLTAHKDHAIQAVKIGALDYLLKPVNQTELQQALAKVLRVLPSQPQKAFINGRSNHIVLRAPDYLQPVELNTVMYCSSDSGYTTFHLSDGKKLVTSKYIKEYEELLLAASFVRVHQSYMVNFQFIDRYYKEGYLVLKDGTQIPVSTRRKDEVIELINRIH